MIRRFDRAQFITEFGKQLRRVREERGLSQAALADMAGFTPQSISNWERGYSVPSLSLAFVLAETLGMHPKELLFPMEE
jgi:transcriptional regulator with XRE-family HTH domain